MLAAIADDTFQPPQDLDGNGIVDQADMDMLIHDVLGTEYGDANLDQKVDVVDLAILAANYGTTSTVTWSQGDFNGDGRVDISDMAILAGNYGFDGTIAPAASAEPMMAAIQSQSAPVTAATTETSDPATIEQASPSAVTAYWQSNQSRKRRNSQRPAMKLLDSKPTNQWLQDESDEDQFDLLSVAGIEVL